MTLRNKDKYNVYHSSRREKLGHELSICSSIKNNNIRCFILDSRSNKKHCYGPFRSYHSLKRWILSKVKSSNAFSNKLGWSYGHIKRSMDTRDSITGTSTKTPTTVAKAAADSRPKSPIATATANSKKFEVPIIAAGAAIR